MKKELVFYKGGLLRFVGHLDVMRTLQRALRRAEIPLCYSQGFNPHPLMGFASPLALGCTGEQELMEIKIEQDMDDAIVMQRLNQELPTGLKILDCRTISEQGSSAMAKVQAALYRIRFPEGAEWVGIVDDFVRQEKIFLTKLGKVKGRKQKVQVDIKPWIYDLQFEDEQTILLLCACGSEQNLKPELFVHEIYKQVGREDLKYSEEMTRLELFGKSKFGFFSLSKPGEV